MQVKIGVHNVSAPTVNEYRVAEVVIHENYTLVGDLIPQNDIALIRLTDRTSNMPIKLPAGELVLKDHKPLQSSCGCPAVPEAEGRDAGAKERAS